MATQPACPLCAGGDCHPYHRDRRREYLQCDDCDLVFVPPQQRLDASAEKTIYDTHENDPMDAGYRRFLSRLFEPLNARLAPGSSGLDFGCGPGPALATMLREAGHQVRLYDLYYAPDESALQQRYDFVCATEVVEHLYRPGEEIERLMGLLKPGGLLGVMTKRVIDAEAFSRWHYKNDQTHVCFFSNHTFEYLARRYDCDLEFVAADAVILQRRG
ncbi:methyltransferase [Marinobacterium nitratireducens]|uniref:Methyltransferase n=1 Tax=Marinobacterium nitratireducens TaxID=518897 RepID=A0A918DNY4_9GAMM|nr:methyltransferase domain-containing protein [Marinobacterium nitratireducens]GGO76152.1 methyltransferase [Marinobacterium nitratireducens]